jgi:hypothetical protein
VPWCVRHVFGCSYTRHVLQFNKNMSGYILWQYSNLSYNLDKQLRYIFTEAYIIYHKNKNTDP